MEWLFWTVYLLGIVPAWRFAFVQWVKQDRKKFGEGVDRSVPAVGTGMLSLVWPVFPVVLPVVLIGWLIVKTPTPDERREKRKREQAALQREYDAIDELINERDEWLERQRLERQRERVAEEYQRMMQRPFNELAEEYEKKTTTTCSCCTEDGADDDR